MATNTTVGFMKLTSVHSLIVGLRQQDHIGKLRGRIAYTVYKTWKRYRGLEAIITFQ
jgi:hypothetical protein